MHPSLIHRPAVDPDLSVRSRQQADVAQFHHRRREVGAELSIVGRVAPDLIVRGPAVKERLVGVEQPLMAEEAGEEAVVEGVRRRSVERREAAIVAAGLGAAASQRRRECPVDVGVRVDPASVVLALRPADGVGPCSNVH